MNLIFAARTVMLHSPGGMQRYAHELARHVGDAGHQVTLFTLPWGPPGASGDALWNGVRYRALPVPAGIRRPSPLAYFAFSRQLSRYLRSAEFDLFHSFGIAAYDYLHSGPARPVVVQGFGNEWFKLRGLSGLLRTPYKRALRACMQRATAIASEGPQQSTDIVTLFGVDRQKIFDLPDGVRRGHALAVGESHEVRRRLGLADDEFLFLNVNRLAQNKGVEYLIEAAAIASARLHRVRIVIAGGGPLEHRLRRLATHRGLANLSFVGTVDDDELERLYKAADAFVCPTLFEGLPLVLLEAMAHGKPVIATAAAENLRIVAHGVNGLVVPPGDSIALADAMVNLRSRNRNQLMTMGNRGKDLVTEYAWPRIAAKAVDKYQEILSVLSNANSNATH